jgi:para-nitrobenzyl esterase
MLTLRQAEEVGAGIVTELGAASVEDLRSRPASDVQLLWPAKPSCRPDMVVDGWVVPEPVHDSFAAGRQHDVPLLTGANSDEASARLPLASLDEWVRALKDEFGDQWKRLFDAYGAGENFGEMSRRLACHKGFNWVNWTWARLHQRSRGADVFFYHFSHAPPLPQDHYAEGRADALGAFHTAEIPYVFGTLDKRDWRATAHDNDLSRIMSSYWVNFAMRGDPNGPGLPHWPQFDAHAPSIMRFNDDVAAGSLPERALMDLWDDCMARLRE